MDRFDNVEDAPFWDWDFPEESQSEVVRMLPTRGPWAPPDVPGNVKVAVVAAEAAAMTFFVLLAARHVVNRLRRQRDLVGESWENTYFEMMQETTCIWTLNMKVLPSK